MRTIWIIGVALFCLFGSYAKVNATQENPRLTRVRQSARGRQLLKEYTGHAWKVRSVEDSKDGRSRTLIVRYGATEKTLLADDTLPLYFQPKQPMDWKRIKSGDSIFLLVIPTNYEDKRPDTCYLQPALAPKALEI